MYTKQPTVPPAPSPPDIASPSSNVASVVLTVTVSACTLSTVRVSVADNDKAILNGPASVVAVDALDVSENVGFITAILIYFYFLIITRLFAVFLYCR
jgi:hypothetical protein